MRPDLVVPLAVDFVTFHRVSLALPEFLFGATPEVTVFLGVPPSAQRLVSQRLT